MANGDSIVYVYGAGGNKLEKLVYENSSLTASTGYAGAYVYKDDLLNFIQSAEGRITKTTSEFVYEYHLKDHIGNVRVAFIDDNGTPKVIQESDYYPFGLKFGEQRIGSDNKYLFSGKEQQDDVVAGVSLDWYDYGARMYSAELGRWHNVDNVLQYHSPYIFVGNDPVNYYDPDGNFSIIGKHSDLTQDKNPREDNGEEIDNRFGEWVENDVGYEDPGNHTSIGPPDPTIPNDVILAWQKSGASGMGISLSDFNETVAKGAKISYTANSDDIVITDWYASYLGENGERVVTDNYWWSTAEINGTEYLFEAPNMGETCPNAGENGNPYGDTFGERFNNPDLWRDWGEQVIYGRKDPNVICCTLEDNPIFWLMTGAGAGAKILQGGKWMKLSEAARYYANLVLKYYKRMGIGAGARSGMHGTPYIRAGNALVKLANNKSLGLIDEFANTLREIGKRWVDKGKSINHFQ